MAQRLQSRSKNTATPRGVAIRKTPVTNNSNVRKALVSFTKQQRVVNNGKSTSKTSWPFNRLT